MLRRGEILGLRDRDIDFDAGSISVFGQQQDGRRSSARRRPPAGARSTSGPATLKLLREQQLARRATQAPRASSFPAAWAGAFDGPNFMARVFKPAARACGFPELTFHDLRHTGASLMIAAGCHVKVIAEQMGHSDGGALVLKRYGHLYKGARRQAAIQHRIAHFLGSDRKILLLGADVGWRPAVVGALTQKSLQIGHGRCRARTCDPLRVKQALYQLS